MKLILRGEGCNYPWLSKRDHSKPNMEITQNLGFRVQFHNFSFPNTNFIHELMDLGVIVINIHNGFVLKSLILINENYFIYFPISPSFSLISIFPFHSSYFPFSLPAAISLLHCAKFATPKHTHKSSPRTCKNHHLCALKSCLSNMLSIPTIFSLHFLQFHLLNCVFSF